MASHPRKFIAQPTDDDLKKFPEDIRHLVKKGREQRYVTHQEIIGALPNAEDDVDLLDEIYVLFTDLGIEVIDVKDALIWEKKSKGGTDAKQQDLADIVSDEPEEAETASDDSEEDADEGSVAEKLDEDDDSDVMQMVATAGIASSGKEDDEKKKKRKEREVDLLEISNDSVRMYLSEIGRVPLIDVVSAKAMPVPSSNWPRRTFVSSCPSPRSTSAVDSRSSILFRRATLASSARSRSSTRSAVSSFRRTQRGGFARRSRAPLPTRPAPSASRCTWSKRLTN